MEINPIKTDDDLREALGEIDRLWNAVEGTPEWDRLDVLVTLVEAYEKKHYPVPKLDPVDTVLGHMDLTGRTQADLARLFGSRSRASEILNRRRPLTLDMIHKLHSDWGIPAELLVSPYEFNAA